MSLKKKILIGVVSLAVVAIIALTSVFAAQSFSATATSTVSFSVGKNVQCDVWIRFAEFKSNETTFSSAKATKTSNVFSASLKAEDSNSEAASFGNLQYTSHGYTWWMIVYIVNKGAENTKITISPATSSATNLVFSSFKSGMTLTKTSDTNWSLSGTQTDVANVDTTGVTIAGATTVGGSGGSVCFTRQIDINSKVSSVGTSKLAWTITLAGV